MTNLTPTPEKFSQEKRKIGTRSGTTKIISGRRKNSIEYEYKSFASNIDHVKNKSFNYDVIVFKNKYDYVITYDVELVKISKLQTDIYRCKDTNSTFHEFKKDQLNVDKKFLNRADKDLVVDLRNFDKFDVVRRTCS